MSAPAQVNAEGLRQRNVPVQANSAEEARKAVLQLNALEDDTDKMDGDKKTFGRTPDGTGKHLYQSYRSDFLAVTESGLMY